jgi:hypothetical protein
MKFGRNSTTEKSDQRRSEVKAPVLFVQPKESLMSSIQIENYSNVPVYVAMAYNYYSDNLLAIPISEFGVCSCDFLVYPP